MVSLTILGSTGSIGCSTLDVVRLNPDRYRIFSLVAGRNLTLLLSQIQEFLPKIVVVADESVRTSLVTRLAESKLDRKSWPELLAGVSWDTSRWLAVPEGVEVVAFEPAGPAT